LDLTSFTHIRLGGRGAPSIEALRALKLVLFDVDGVMTDGRIVLTDMGMQAKFFDVRDGAGVNLLQLGGIMAGLVTGRKSSVVDVRAKEIKVPPERVRQGATVKLPVVKQLLAELNIERHEFGFMGDDLIDLPVIQYAAFACCPAESYVEVEAASHVVSVKRGGRGAVRTICEFILKARDDGSWQRAVNSYLGVA